MENQAANRLLQKYLSGKCTPEEQESVENWLEHSDVNDNAWSTMSADERANYLLKVRNRLLISIEQKPVRNYSLWPRYLGIAAAVAAIAFGIWFYEVASTRTALPRNDVAYKNDIAPGKNTAVLIVNGKQTQLSDAKAGIVVNDDIKYNDGTQVDSSALGMTDGVSRALEVITPKGGTYSIILQDGTKVWLNADSKLEVLPIFWNKAQRLVRLTGEGYFEVAKVFTPGGRGRGPERVPFIVESNRQRVEVLGTHFNISAYKGEAIRTTLLEGSVRVASLLSPLRGEMSAGQRGDVTLKPNQQAILSDNGIKCIQVDANEAIAWKDGLFVFANEPLEDILKRVARWYNVEIVYNGIDPQKKFGGGVSRYDNISKVLEKLELTGGIHFKIDGRKVYVGK